MADFAFLHTCYRIGEIDRSVAFYAKLGLREQRRMPIGDEAINIFLGTDAQPNILELTYNHGVSAYELGTAYGHIALGVADLDATLAALAADGITPEKPPYQVRAGGSRLCFVRDPDNYRIELIERRASAAS
ncbi:MAG: VOC family protein [Patulibacter sp.]